ncbi:MAG: BMP family ABC transporter substrate-binding protein [Clostridiales bacterium]|nr:BMP family ABC transporter substrate-binding protein [bacterium 210917-SL.2.15]MCI5843149.1 BMP family ABC transporter substrate-binding protein [Clostridiales bacterium]MDY4037522.1 BMP family ABC transporter substrate-binding protein [Candidatus Pseudoscilispira sp.]
MKRILALGCSIALAAMLLAGCGNGGNNEQPSGGEGTGIAVEDVKVGVIHIGDPATGSGYSYTHDQGIVAMQETLGLSDDQIVRKNNIDDGNTTAIENAMNECIEEGCNIIFATSWGYMDTCEALAAEYPNVFFSHATGYKSNETNFNHYFGRIYQARYLSGIVAGMKTETNKIGYVSAMGSENGECTSGIDAFAMGVASVNPEATVEVKVTNSWYDPEGEGQAAQALIDDGCDVIAQHCDTNNPQIAARDAGVWGVGYNSDMTAEVGESVLTSVVWNWGAYYTAAVQNVIDGTWTPGVHVEDYFGSMADGLLNITDLSEEAAEGTQEAVDVARAAIEDGSFDVFTGTYTDAAGNTVGCDGVMECNDGTTLEVDGANYAAITAYYKNVVVK